VDTELNGKEHGVLWFPLTWFNASSTLFKAVCIAARSVSAACDCGGSQSWQTPMVTQKTKASEDVYHARLLHLSSATTSLITASWKVSVHLWTPQTKDLTTQGGQHLNMCRHATKNPDRLLMHCSEEGSLRLRWGLHLWPQTNRHAWSGWQFQLIWTVCCSVVPHTSSDCWLSRSCSSCICFSHACTQLEGEADGYWVVSVSH